jgi:2-polyprenyl-3-methyl-5-hydroxy-6-metoxy-1,4-benzoquinol methylase
MQNIKRIELMKKLSEKKKFYEHIAKTKGDTDEYWATGFSQSLLIEKIQKILQGVVNKRIIDVGCGDGRTVFYLAKGNNTVIGIDVSYTRLSRAKKKALRYANRTLFLQSYAEDLPIKDLVFDGAVCTEVLEHVIDDDALLRGLSHVLKPHAWVFMSIPTVSLSRYFDMRFTKQLIYFDPVEHVREFSYVKVPPFEDDFILIRDLVKKLRDYGFTIKTQYGVGFDLPLGILRFRIGRFFEKIFRNKRVNRFIIKLPVFKKFGVYTILMLQKVQQNL